MGFSNLSVSLSCALLWAALAPIPGVAFNKPQTGQSTQTAAPPPAMSAEGRGDILMARKMYREAIEMYQQAPQNSAVIWNKMGIAYHQMLQLDAAKKRYQRAIHLDPKYAEAINNLGTIYYAHKQYGKAINCYRRALKLDAKSASMFSNLGTAYYCAKKYKEASEAYESALHLDPDVFEHRGGFGSLIQESSVSDRAQFHYYWAKMYAKAGQDDRALLYIRKALEEGFKDRKLLLRDPEFAHMRELPEFKELLTLEPRVL